MAADPSGSLTFLFSDIEGSTRLLTRLGDSFQAVHADHQRLLREAWAADGGGEISTEGDSFFVVFPTAVAALQAAAAAHRALAAHAWPPGAAVHVRIGVHTGRAIRVGDDYLGLDVHRAARIAAAGHGGQTLVSESTRDAAAGGLPPGLRLRDLGRHRLKDVGVHRLWQLDVAGLATSFPSLRSLDAHPTNLPPDVTALVDREADVRELADRLKDGPVVTLTGPGGIGKSRVAVAAARTAVASFPDGVFYLDLAAIDNPDQAAERLLAILELPADPDAPARAALVAGLGGRSVLLVLDNGDRVSGLATLVAELARACAGVRVLATSRSPLRIGAERELPIRPLELPSGGTGLESVRSSPAAMLFAERARDLFPSFTITEANALDIADICRRLDGLPLAIELAAARTRVLPVPALRERLATRLPLLAGGARDAPDRQRTMRAAIAWSYDLLGDAERVLLDRLAVFEGPFELEAAEAVGAATDNTDTVMLLEALVERSLVARVDAEEPEESTTAAAREPMFRLLGTIREFAAEMLDGGPVAEGARDSHLRHWLVFVRRESDRRDVDDVAVGTRIERHAAEYAAALDRALAPDPAGRPALAADALALAAALGRHWWLHGHLRDGVSWLERAIVATGSTDHPDTALALYWAGVLHEGLGDDDLARSRLEQALERYTAAGDRRGVARCLNSLGVAARSIDDPERARSLLTRALAASRELGDKRGVAIALSNLGIVELDTDHNDAALAVLEEAVGLDREVGSRAGTAYSLLAYGSALRRVSRIREAVEAILESLGVFAELGDAEGVADGLDELGEAALVAGRAEVAARLFASTMALRRREGVRLRPVDVRKRQPALDAVKATVDATLLERFASDSAAIDVDAALAIAGDAGAAIGGPQTRSAGVRS